MAVIGAGSSGIQVVPALVGQVKSMDHYVRGRTWITNQISDDLLKERSHEDAEVTNFEYTPEERAKWRQSPQYYIQYRKQLERQLQGNYAISRRNSTLHDLVKQGYIANMKRRLAAKSELADMLIPDFPPLCKRLTPGPGYLEALTEPKVHVITEPIDRINQRGVVTTDGIEHLVDAIVCATGFETSFEGGFPIYGRDGINLRKKYATHPRSYLGLCTDNFPNFFQSLGPNSFQGAGNLLITLEQTHDYVAKVLQRLSTGNILTVEPKRRSVQNFTNYCEEYFKDTVYTMECASWYKPAPPGSTRDQQHNARVTALWPGSGVHAIKALSSVRWEDFEMETCDGNEFGWFGNGWTLGDQDPGNPNTDQLTWYLNNTELMDESLTSMLSTTADDVVSLTDTLFSDGRAQEPETPSATQSFWLSNCTPEDVESKKGEVSDEWMRSPSVGDISL